jgi:hypothetical protein
MLGLVRVEGDIAYSLQLSHSTFVGELKRVSVSVGGRGIFPTGCHLGFMPGSASCYILGADAVMETA